MSQAETWTVGRLLQWTTDYLKRHGADSPRLDAEVLLGFALGCPRIQLYTTFDQEPGEAARGRFRELVRRRAEGEPVAYLVGRREFYSLSFRVTPDVLIPRPETEMLVVGLLDLAKQRSGDGPIEICDVGTGSGILAVCAAKYLPEAHVTAVDFSPGALEVARSNAAEHGVESRITFVQSDLLDGLPDDRPFDFVLSNPPYVSESEYAALAPEVRKYEPRMALLAGPTGTEVMARLIPQACQRLRPGAWLLMEISPMIQEAVLALVSAETRLEQAATIKDLARHARVVQARRRGE